MTRFKELTKGATVTFCRNPCNYNKTKVMDTTTSLFFFLFLFFFPSFLILCSMYSAIPLSGELKSLPSYSVLMHCFPSARWAVRTWLRHVFLRSRMLILSVWVVWRLRITLIWNASWSPLETACGSSSVGTNCPSEGQQKKEITKYSNYKAVGFPVEIINSPCIFLLSSVFPGHAVSSMYFPA